jgi:tRNA (guanine-N7-)-methyltransferase
MRRKHNLTARLEKCSHLLIEDPRLLRGRWLCEFHYSELHVELGCGKGRFTVEAAKARPDVLFAALEKTENVMVIALELADKEGVQNVRFASSLADGVTDFFAPGEVSRIYLNFSDPWPSHKHLKRRLTSQGYLESYRQVLRPGGEIHFKTDNLPFFEFSLREFTRAGFVLLEEIRDLHKNGPVGIMTDYELKFHGLGMPIYQCLILNA